jgi:riboflavin synthase
MFSGLVEVAVPVLELELAGEEQRGARLRLPAPELGEGLPGWAPAMGESIAVSGCCLSVAGIGVGGETVFDLSAETLRCTWFDELEPGRLVNLERSVRPFDRLGGHLVSGHVDGVGEIAGIEDSGDGCQTFTFRVPEGFERYLVSKGSVSVEGISLTVVEPRGRDFDVAVIPETLARTNLGRARVGQRVHLEADMIGKWVERMLLERGSLPPTSTEGPCYGPAVHAHRRP